jgi:molybdenum cofactor biosynthesis enzyme MoaA
MAEDMTFLPKAELLTLEEMDRLCSAFVRKGVRKLRLTGGEPLVRKNLMWLIKRLSRHLDSGALDELTLTTNGSQLGKHAAELAACGVKRVNVSIDTLDPDKFARITRWGKLAPVLDGIKAANAAGIKVKINTVALKGVNDDEAFDLIDWCGREGHDITFIEVMPMGDIGGEMRLDQYLPISLLRAKLRRATRSRISTTAPAVRRATRISPRPGSASASSRRSPTTSAKVATACASPAPACFTCAWARMTAPTCARRCVPAGTIRSCWTRSTKPSAASPRATTSS